MEERGCDGGDGRELDEKAVPVRVLLLGLVACAVLVGTLVLLRAQALAAGGEPVVSDVSVTSITEDGATLEAQINPEGSAMSHKTGGKK